MTNYDNMTEDQLDSEIAKLQNEIKELGGDKSGTFSDYPKAVSQDSIYKFFREILNIKVIDKLSKVGNIEKEEIGKIKLGVRNYMEIASYAEAEGLNTVADYLNNKAAIILSTSLSKKAKLLNTFVTQIKKQESITGTKEEKKKKSGWGKEKESE